MNKRNITPVKSETTTATLVTTLVLDATSHFFKTTVIAELPSSPNLTIEDILATPHGRHLKKAYIDEKLMDQSVEIHTNNNVERTKASH